MPGYISEIDTQSQPDPLPTAGQRCILLVEDDPYQLEILEYRLQEMNFAVTTLNRGRHVIETARQLQPDLILLDIELPDTSGLDLCAELADDPATSAIPVVIVSGTEQTDVVRAARKAGCKFFLCKPYDPNALLLIAEHSIREADRWI